MSAAGIVASGLAAVAVGEAAWAAGVLPSGRAAAAAAAAGLAGSLAESVLARTTLGQRVGHHGRNGAVSAISAAGVLLAWALGWARA